MGWVKVKWIDPMFNAFNAAFPNRTKGSDGTIGDKAHEDEKSGHNADDTPGSKPEREDADTKAEVRADDVTSDLRDPRGIRMWDVVQSILATPDDLIRLIYMICDGRIWRKANGWREEKYDGKDQHYGHGHFSGDPAYDEDGRPWPSILKFIKEDEVAGFGFPDKDMGPALAWRMAALKDGSETVKGGPVKGETMQVMADVHKLQADVSALQTGGVTQDMVTAGLKEALKDPAVLAVLAPFIQQQSFEGSQRAEKE